MKKTLLALAAALVAGSALATSTTPAVGTGTSYSGGVTVSGSINNTINTGASVSGVGSSFSSAGMTSIARATATVTAPTVASADGTTTISGSITGSTYTLNNGFAYNVSSGAGTGSASAIGGATASAGGNLTMNALNCDPAEGRLVLTGTAASSTGVEIATNGINSGGWAGVESGSEFSAQGSLSLTVIPSGATIGGEVKDIKNATSFTNSGAGAINFGEAGAPAGFATVQPTVLVGNATSTVNATGSFTGFKDISGGELPKCDTGECGGGGGNVRGPQGNNGYGNGDQNAPGNSLDNNNAENGPNGRGNGKPQGTPQFNRNKG